MDKPKCRLCGYAHWSHEPHQWSDNDKKPTQKRVRSKPPGTPVILPSGATASVASAPLTQAERSKRWRVLHRDPLQWAKYMREYRAKRKQRYST